jgi:hypothetical protein
VAKVPLNLPKVGGKQERVAKVPLNLPKVGGRQERVAKVPLKAGEDQRDKSL